MLVTPDMAPAHPDRRVNRNTQSIPTRPTGFRHVLAALIAAMLLAAPAYSQPKMIFIGDSITNAWETTDPDVDGFVPQLAERFPELLMINAGCAGATVRDWTTDEPTIYCVFGNAWYLLAEPELPAQLSHIMLGTNDAIGFFEPYSDETMGRWVPPDEYASRLRELVQRAPGLVLLSSPPKNPGQLPGPTDARLRAYRDEIAVIVDEYDYVVDGVDSYTLLDPDTDMIGVHPNDQGHAKIADALERRILDVLPKGALAPCGNEVACGVYRLLPQYRHPRGRPSREGGGRHVE